MSTGKLYVVATPIGNFNDITVRALDTLREVTTIYCEDTRRTGRLLAHFGISTPMRSLHAHSSDQRIDQALRELLTGNDIAYCSDAGTPGISDPGSKLVARAVEQQIAVSPIPGPSAFAALASIAGFHEKEILFTGFLSKKKGKRQKELMELASRGGNMIAYESPHRIDALLDDIAAALPGYTVILGRELTKTHEEILRGNPEEIRKLPFQRKGEFSVAIFRKKQ